MSGDDPDPSADDRRLPSGRREPVGEPVIRGDPEISGARADRAKRFDPEDPDSLADAVETVRDFATESAEVDSLDMLRGAAACAALVRGVGSYKEAAERAGEDVSVGFLRKWARVHDLPMSIRRRVATADITPSAAGHIARVTGDARFTLAWASVDHDLSVREVRSIASDVVDGRDVADALRDHGVTPGRVEVTLPTEQYRELRRRAVLDGRSVDDALAEAVDQWLEE